ncbi:MAG: hypothetical protein RLZZ612_2088 [Pseudomonadota bacterium]|jgi:hypothetical protein
MKTESEIRMVGMQALIASLGLVEAERFLAAVSRERLNYTEWRRNGLPSMSLETLAAQANSYTEQVNAADDTH